MAEQLRTFLRLKQVKALTGLSRSWIYDAIRRKDFPPPIALSAKAVAWDAADIAAWQARRIEQSRKAAAWGCTGDGTKTRALAGGQGSRGDITGKLRRYIAHAELLGNRCALARETEATRPTAPQKARR